MNDMSTQSPTVPKKSTDFSQFLDTAATTGQPLDNWYFVRSELRRRLIDNTNFYEDADHSEGFSFEFELESNEVEMIRERLERLIENYDLEKHDSSKLKQGVEIELYKEIIDIFRACHEQILKGIDTSRTEIRKRLAKERSEKNQTEAKHAFDRSFECYPKIDEEDDGNSNLFDARIYARRACLLAPENEIYQRWFELLLKLLNEKGGLQMTKEDLKREKAFFDAVMGDGEDGEK